MPEGFISGFALISLWAIKRIVPTTLGRQRGFANLNFDAVALPLYGL